MDRYIEPEALDATNQFYQDKIYNYQQACHEYEICVLKLNSLPSKIVLQTTDRCNLKCPICQLIPDDKKNSMSRDVFERVIEELFPTLIELHPTNVGEALVSPWFDYLCERMRHFGILLDITTNGTLLSEQKIEQILPIIRDIKFSFDGATKESFERKRVGADFAKVCNNVRMLSKAIDQSKQKRRVNIALQMTIMRSNYQDLPSLIELASDIGANCVKAYHLFSFTPETDKESIITDLDIWLPVLERSLKLGEYYNIDLQLAEPLYKSSGIPDNLKPTICHLPWHESWIDYDGSVYNCHSHRGVSVGNILEEDFFTIWNSDLYQRIRQGFADGKPIGACYNCGMNYQKQEEHQEVPYDIHSFLSPKHPIQANPPKNIYWSNRMRPFDLSCREK